MSKKTFFSWLLLAILILISSGVVSYVLSSNFQKECKIFIDSSNPTNLVISSNCEVITTNTKSK